MAAAILLYLALTKQIEALKEQKLKSEVDMIFLLLNQLDHELESFFSKETEVGTNKVTVLRGAEGLFDFSSKYLNEYIIDDIHKQVPEFTFKTFPQTRTILVIVDSLLLIEERINQTTVSDTYKKLFWQKLTMFYKYKMEMYLKLLIKGFAKYPHQKDEYTTKIEALVDHMSTSACKSERF